MLLGLGTVVSTRYRPLGVVFSSPPRTTTPIIDHYYGALDQINGRPYAVLICAGSDGQNAARQVERIATGWRLKPVAPPLVVCTHAQTPEAILRPKVIGAEDLARCRETGATIAAGLVLGVF